MYVDLLKSNLGKFSTICEILFCELLYDCVREKFKRDDGIAVNVCLFPPASIECTDFIPFILTKSLAGLFSELSAIPI